MVELSLAITDECPENRFCLHQLLQLLAACLMIGAVYAVYTKHELLYSTNTVMKLNMIVGINAPLCWFNSSLVKYIELLKSQN